MKGLALHDLTPRKQHDTRSNTDIGVKHELNGEEVTVKSACKALGYNDAAIASVRNFMCKYECSLGEALERYKHRQRVGGCKRANTPWGKMAI